MNDAPSSQAALPFSRSTGVNSSGFRVVASARPSGGVMPAAITAAMIVSGVESPPAAVAPAPSPAAAKV